MGGARPAEDKTKSCTPFHQHVLFLLVAMAKVSESSVNDSMDSKCFDDNFEYFSNIEQNNKFGLNLLRTILQ